MAETEFGEMVELLKKGLTSGPANAAGFFGEYGTKIGQFFGVTSPATKNMVDFAREIQLYAQNKATKEELADRAVQDIVNWKVADMMSGWPSFISTPIAGIISKLSGVVAQPLVNLATREISGMVTPDAHDGGTSPTPLPGVKKPSPLGRPIHEA